MALDGSDDRLDDLVPEKKKGKMGGAAAKSKILLFALIVGLILGGFAMHFLIEPMLKEAESSTCKDCLASKELLGKENDCLYGMVPDAKAAIASCTNKEYAPETQEETTPKPIPEPDIKTDANESATPDTNAPTPDDNEVA